MVGDNTINPTKEYIDKIREWIKTGVRNTLIVYGPTGSGKTYSVMEAIRAEGYRAINIDIEDYEKLWRLSQTRFPFKGIIVGDNIYKIDNRRLRKIVQKTRNRIILIAESVDIFSSTVQTASAVIRFWPPDAKTLLKFAKSIGVKSFKNLPHDLRQVVYRAKYNSMGYKSEESITSSIKKYMATGNSSHLPDDDVSLIILLDNLKAYYGIDRVKMILKLYAADLTGRKEPLEFKPVNAKILDSYFLGKAKEARR